MNIAFTICSNNYLAQASILAESFKQFNPDCYFIIVLVDEFSEIVDYKSIASDDIVRITELDGYNLKSIFTKYDIIELSTAVKPFVFKYLMKRFYNCKNLYYFDPDIKFFSNISVVDKDLQKSSVVLTPHIFSPIPMDGMTPQEPLFLNYGLYNLGFLGLNTSHVDSIRLLDWWSERTFEIGYADVNNGLFVDQLWMNFVPLFYSDVLISFNKGLNMGPWNLHERKIKAIEGDNIIIDNDDCLMFYHFSSYDYKKPSFLSKHYSRYSLESEGLLKKLYSDYHNDLLKFNVEKYSLIEYVHGKRKKVVVSDVTIKQKIKSKILRFLS